MRKNSFVFFALFCLICALLWSCGGGGGSGTGSPGSEGSENTGVILDASITPRYLDQNTISVDVFQQLDCDADPTTNDPEDFTSHFATLTVNARLVNPNTTFRVGDLTIEKYTIEYFRSDDSIGSPPIERDARFQTINIPAPAGSGVVTVTDSVMFVDLVRKDRYLNDVTSGQFSSGLSLINNYTARYTFEGKNQFGESFQQVVQVNFEIGSFDFCE